ncbi:hypothetical protein [Burkholderia sp. S-53]|uniref:hypothetical protein n=1 Tax=Burkholderia sp. S-53 TaxID=2906514 RepID=UPI0021D389ED|nr:hypothetical protein [Burkholderia sp. S-53]UXU92178.1 hypothetical protein LXM88_28965 [Burkholderia sp. S-53]
MSVGTTGTGGNEEAARVETARIGCPGFFWGMIRQVTEKTEQEIEMDHAVDWKKIADGWQQVKIADVKNAKHSDRPESFPCFMNNFR